MILEFTQDLQDAVTREAAQLVCAEIDKVQAVLHGASNMLAVIRLRLCGGIIAEGEKVMEEAAARKRGNSVCCRTRC